jgi:RND family efflux transporter MFP subunit
MLTTACSRPEAGGPPGGDMMSQALPVKVVALQPSPVEDSSASLGSLEATEKATLQPQTQGRIEQVFVSSGDRVTKGTPVASLSIDETQADVATAQASVSAAQAARRTAEAELQRAQADRVSAVAERDLRQSNYSRTAELVNEGALPQTNLDQDRRDLDVARAELAAADKEVNAARATVAQSASAVREAQARVASQSVSLDFKRVTSPINGIVGDLPVKVGDYVTTETTVTTITRNDQLDMDIQVPSGYKDRLRLGLPVQLIDLDSNKLLGTGSISFISPQIDTEGQSILVKARFPNSNGSLRDGQRAQAKIVWNRTSGVLVPTTAITRVGGQAFVYAVDQKTEAGQSQTVVSQRPVKLGSVQGNSYVILEGLKAGDKIATTNILKLRDGAPVQPEA